MLLMSYQADKPFGRRRTDTKLSADEQQHLERIRRDVDQDSTGLIRRYLRLSEKLLGLEDDKTHRRKRSAALDAKASATRRAA
jgi:hypothetical protein